MLRNPAAFSPTIHCISFSGAAEKTTQKAAENHFMAPKVRSTVTPLLASQLIVTMGTFINAAGQV
jgi:hypothetical protein